MTADAYIGRKFTAVGSTTAAWSMNDNNCDAMADGIVAPGMQGLDQATGNLLLDFQGTACIGAARKA